MTKRITYHASRITHSFVLLLFTALITAGQTNPPSASSTNLPAWLTRPLSLGDAVDLALRQNANILKGKSDIEAAYGVVVQTRAIALPRVRSTGNFIANDPGLQEKFPSPIPVNLPNENWLVDLKL